MFTPLTFGLFRVIMDLDKKMLNSKGDKQRDEYHKEEGHQKKPRN